MKKKLLFGLLVLAGCGSEPEPACFPQQYTAMVMTTAKAFPAEEGTIVACGNRILGSGMAISGTYKFEGYSTAVTCYQKLGNYLYFSKMASRKDTP